jgi:hypothetical protein
MTTYQAPVTLNDYTQAAANVLIRALRDDFITYVVAFLPIGVAGLLTPLIALVAGFIFDWVGKQAAFMAFCKYTDFRVAHQSSVLGIAIYNEIQAKREGNLDAILQAEKDADIAFDNFVTLFK